MILARDERTHYDWTRCGLVGKSYARGYEIQAHCRPDVTRGGLTTMVATRRDALVELVGRGGFACVPLSPSARVAAARVAETRGLFYRFQRQLQSAFDGGSESYCDLR
jgi:hypothetical protein